MDGMAKRSARRSQGSNSRGPWRASIFSNNPGKLLESDFAQTALDLERSLGMPLWLLVQDGIQDTTPHEFDMIGQNVASAFFASRGGDLKPDQKIALLVDSYGGRAESAYVIAWLLREYCGGFTAIIPRRAKSAATLLCLGAERVIMADFGELGPLDMQYDDPEREEPMSVLDEVQSLERLTAFTMSAFDEVMFMLIPRTRMKVKTLLPHVTEVVNSMTRPLFENIDVVRYTQMSRLLKVAEEYAIRLLTPRFDQKTADAIARQLAERYPEHGFIISRDEAEEIGLQPEQPTEEQSRILSRMIPQLSGLTAIGAIREVNP